MSWLDGGVGGGGEVLEDDYLWGETRSPNRTLEEKCEAAFKYDYHVAVAVSCVMVLVFGIVYSLFGYRCFKAVMFLTGFIFGSVVVYLVCLSEALLPVMGNAGVSLAAGLMFGLITMLVQYVGLFMTGFHTGLFLGVAGIATAYPWWVPSSVWVVVGLLLGAGLLMAVLNLYFQKGLTILGTAISGGALMAATLDYFIEKFVMVQWLVERLVVSSSSESVCWFSWLILGVWPFMVVVGTLTQCCITGTGTYHAQLSPLKGGRPPSTHQQRVRSRQARAEVRQKKYRYLYQVRTAHGDIISQEYIQSLQRKAYPTQSCDNGTLQSDSTHTTMLPPDHTPLAPLTESEDEGAGTPCSRPGTEIPGGAGTSYLQQGPPPQTAGQTNINIHHHDQRHQEEQYNQGRRTASPSYPYQHQQVGVKHRPVSQGSSRYSRSDVYNSGVGVISKAHSDRLHSGNSGCSSRNSLQDNIETPPQGSKKKSAGGVAGAAAPSGSGGDHYQSSSPDDHYSELQYTPSPHSSSSPGNYRRQDRYNTDSGSQNTPPPSPVSPLPPSPSRPHCVPR